MVRRRSSTRRCSILRVSTILVAGVLLWAEGLWAGAQQESPLGHEVLSATQQNLVEGAERLLGRDAVVIRGREFPMDCSGVVRAVYYYAGIDLTPALAHFEGGGVARLYAYLADLDLLHASTYPQPGDIVFWDDTYDRDGNGKRDDELTHTGMVVAVSSDGRVEYVHHNYRKGIVMEYLNLCIPDVHETTVEGARVIVNSPMRMRSAGGTAGAEWLSGQLFRAFGRAYAADDR